MASPKTTAVLFKDGTEGRGVKLTNNNVFRVSIWLGDAFIENNIGEDKEGASAKVKETRVKLYKNGSKQALVAKAGDSIVKTKAGFTVIKAADFEKYIKI